MSGAGHRIDIKEMCRCPNVELRKEAVLVLLNGTNFKLFVVRSGKEVHGAQGVLSLGHAELAPPYLEWLDKRGIRVHAGAGAIFAPDRFEVVEGAGFIDVLARHSF